MNNYVRDLTAELVETTEIPEFIAGDTITVHYKIKEGEKEGIQQFQGVVLQRKGTGKTATFTVRKISNGIGVERVFPIASPFIDKIEVNKTGKVRRARIFYLRDRTGKAARIKERRNAASATAAADAKAAKAKAKAEKAAAEQEQKAAKKAEAKKQKAESTAKDAQKTEAKAEAKLTEKKTQETKKADTKPAEKAPEAKKAETKPAEEQKETKNTEAES